jgi:PAS domain S-box-containing protein
MKKSRKLLLGIIGIVLLVAVVGAIAVKRSKERKSGPGETRLSGTELISTGTEEVIPSSINNRTAIITWTLISLPAVAFLGYVFGRIVPNPAAAKKRSAHETPEGKLDAEGFHELLERRVRERTEELAHANAKLKEQVMLQPLAQKSLQRRIKQLDCLYGLSRLIEPSQVSLGQIFSEAVRLIRNVYRYPDATCVRITFDGIQYKTDKFEKSELSQYAQVKVRGDKAGDIEVYYLGDKAEDAEGPFLQEERDLLDAVAERLGSVAERKQAEEKLQLFRNLIDRSNDCIFVMEPEWGRFLDANDRACECLGYTRKELLRMSLKDIDQSVADDSSWQQQTEELRGEGDIVKQGRHKRKDETTFFVEMSFKLVRQQKEEYIIAVSRDITERKQAEEKQAELLEEVESVNRELKDFAYIVSHDLKAPLRGIKTLADWIAGDYADKFDEEGKEQMNLLLSRVERMHNLIDGVLQYSRVGRVEEKTVEVNLNEVVPDVIDMVAPPENIKITVENKLPVVRCDKTRIMQVFQNLLSNAVKYMDKPQGRVKIGCAEDNGFWKFSVADNGPGIEEKHFERIFRIFQTLSPRDEFESTGIGLTVIRKIVELHSGKIWVESKVGEGSTFFFTLPKSEGQVKNAKLEANIAC